MMTLSVVFQQHTCSPIYQTIKAITQRLQFLKNQSFIVDPQQITIDCSHTELTAIRNIFPGCTIQYCLFHVSQAWGRQLALKVRSGTGVPVDNRVLRGEMMAHLKVLLYEEDLDVFQSLIKDFKVRYAFHYVFIEYFDRNCCGEDKFNIWSRAYHPLEFSYMLTSNYIESWHNHLKCVYLKRSRNRRLDRLIFILTVEIEYEINEAYNRAIEINGSMTRTERRRWIQLTADRVPVERREAMIANPLGDLSSTAVPGLWFVESFTDEDISYNANVNEALQIRSCTCYDFRKRSKPCKHIYLLKTHIPSLTLVTSPIVPRLLLLSSTDFVSTFSPASTPEPSAAQNNSIVCQQMVASASTLHHMNQDILRMASFATSAKLLSLKRRIDEAFGAAQETKDRYNNRFRTIDTQRH